MEQFTDLKSPVHVDTVRVIDADSFDQQIKATLYFRDDRTMKSDTLVKKRGMTIYYIEEKECLRIYKIEKTNSIK